MGDFHGVVRGSERGVNAVANRRDRVTVALGDRVAEDRGVTWTCKG